MKNIVYIVDDHNMVRNGLKSWLEKHTKWRVPKDFASSKECLDCLNCLSKTIKNEVCHESRNGIRCSPSGHRS